MTNNGKINVYGNGGFHMEFENGLTISVQIHAGAYCENRNKISFRTQNKVSCKNAEIAIWDTSGTMITKRFIGTDDVRGWLSPDTIADLIYRVKNTTIADLMYKE